MRRNAKSLATEFAHDDIVERLLGGDEMDSENALPMLLARHRQGVPGARRQTLDQADDVDDTLHAADGATYAAVVPPELIERTMQLVRYLSALAALPGSTLVSSQVAENSLFPKHKRVRFDTLGKTPRFFFSPCRGTQK
jgi:hypothetical protein